MAPVRTHQGETAASTTAKPVREPKPPFPRQHQEAPGLESEMRPAPRWRGERYRPAGKLEGQAALITGGDSGIGRAVAYFFAREGADVAITCLPEEREDADVVADAVAELGRRCEVIECDFTDDDAPGRAVERTLAVFGRLDVLVHNAASQSRKEVSDLTDEDLDRTMKVNVYAYLRLVREAVPRMKPGSSIIATGSVVGLSGSARLADYGATKGAIHAISKCLAEELIDKQIRVNAVAPGPVWTPLNPSDAGLTAAEVAKFGIETGESKMGRPAQPEELAPAFVYLASNADSSYVNGIVLPVTGQPS